MAASVSIVAGGSKRIPPFPPLAPLLRFAIRCLRFLHPLNPHPSISTPSISIPSIPIASIFVPSITSNFADFSMRIAPLSTIDECRQVAALEREIWGYDDSEDVLPPPVLVVSAKRGGILLGAFDAAGTLKGFVYSTPAVRNGELIQWSHVLGVVAELRNSGLGAELKLAQRDAALRMGVDLIEWTFDPLQALNAHFNFAKLGVVAEEYEENLYGSLTSPLHAGAPTDRLLAQWHIRKEHVERRLASWGRPSLRDMSVARAGVVNPSAGGGRWPSPGQPDLNSSDPRVLVEIPAGFTGMLVTDPPLALAWRLHTREVFQAYFARGYRAVDFFVSQEAGRGQYLLVRQT